MRSRLAAGLALLLLLLGGAAWIHHISTRVSEVVEATKAMSSRVLNKPQYILLHPCPPDGRTVFVGRAPGMTGEEFVLAAHRLATDRVFRGEGVILEKTTIWSWADPSGTSITIEVVTPRGRDETEDEWCERHDRLVAIARERFPSE